MRFRQQAAQVDDMLHVLRRQGKIERGRAVARTEVCTAAHGMDQIVGGVNAGQRGCQCLLDQQIAGEDFDMSRKELGGAVGVRTMFGDHVQVYLHARYTAVGDANLTTGFFDTDTLVGVGVAWELIRGLSLVGDYESGEFSNLSIGFRLDLSED